MTEFRVALIGGAGFMGKAHSLAYAHAAFLENQGATIVREVLVDVDPAAAAAAASQLGWNRSSSNWQEVINDPTINIIDIVTPPHTHAMIAAAAIAAGKHVFCEKPLTNDADEAVALAAVAAASGVVHQVGFNYRYTPMISHAKAMIERGELGQPLQLRASYLVDGGFWVPDFGWRKQRSTGGSGATGDLGSHVIDMALHLCGPIRRVAALERSYAGAQNDDWGPRPDEAQSDVPDGGAMWLAEFANGAMGTFSASFYSAGRANAIRMELDGSRGALQFDWNKNNEIDLAFVDDPQDKAGFRRVIAAEPSLWYPIPGLGYGYIDGSAAQIVSFVQAILNDGTAAPGFAEAAHAQQVVEAVARSSTTRSWVDVPPIAAAGSAGSDREDRR
jgi:predicted dehydrogenase